MWDASAKKWYWEGEAKDLPEKLIDYCPEEKTRREKEAREAREADRRHAYELEEQGKLAEALEIVKSCHYEWGYDGEGEIYRCEDIARLEEKLKIASAANTVKESGGNEVAQAVAAKFVESSINAQKAAAQNKRDAQIREKNKAHVTAVKAANSNREKELLSIVPAIKNAVLNSDVINLCSKEFNNMRDYLQNQYDCVISDFEIIDSIMQEHFVKNSDFKDDDFVYVGHHDFELVCKLANQCNHAHSEVVRTAYMPIFDGFIAKVKGN